MRIRGPLLLLLVIAAVALLSTAGQILGLYTDWLWFREVQFTSVFVTVLRTEVLLGVVTIARMSTGRSVSVCWSCSALAAASAMSR